MLNHFEVNREIAWVVEGFAFICLNLNADPEFRVSQVEGHRIGLGTPQSLRLNSEAVLTHDLVEENEPVGRYEYEDDGTRVRSKVSVKLVLALMTQCDWLA